MEAIFELTDLTYRYLGSWPALEGITLSIRPKEKVAVLGANGCGKSTLLHILDGLLFAQEGSATAFGCPLTEGNLEDGDFAREFRRRVGLVFQNPDVQLFSPTVREEVAFGPLQLGLSQEEVARRVGRTLEMLGLSAIAERHPYELSEGEKKKVAIASVLACDPEVMLLDEPTAGLDPKTQAWVVDWLVEMNGRGKTIVTATHDLTIVPDTADRIYILGEDHTLLAEGRPDELLKDEALLIKANLAHFHVHRHGRVAHAHPHRHVEEHHHQHQTED